MKVWSRKLQQILEALCFIDLNMLIIEYKGKSGNKDAVASF